MTTATLGPEILTERPVTYPANLANRGLSDTPPHAGHTYVPFPPRVNLILLDSTHTRETLLGDPAYHDPRNREPGNTSTPITKTANAKANTTEKAPTDPQPEHEIIEGGTVTNATVNVRILLL